MTEVCSVSMRRAVSALCRTNVWPREDAQTVVLVYDDYPACAVLCEAMTRVFSDHGGCRVIDDTEIAAVTAADSAQIQSLIDELFRDAVDVRCHVMLVVSALRPERVSSAVALSFLMARAVTVIMVGLREASADQLTAMGVARGAVTIVRHDPAMFGAGLEPASGDAPVAVTSEATERATPARANAGVLEFESAGRKVRLRVPARRESSDAAAAVDRPGPPPMVPMPAEPSPAPEDRTGIELSEAPPAAPAGDEGTRAGSDLARQRRERIERIKRMGDTR